MSNLDVILVLLLAVAFPTYDYFWDWPRMKRRLESSDPRARLDWYRTIFVIEWVFTAAVLAVFVKNHRPLAGLGLDLPHGLWLVGAILYVGLAIALMVMQVRAIAASAATRERVRQRATHIQAIFPRTVTEMRWFDALSITAGVCEELLYRGYLPWCFKPFIG